MVLYKVSPFFDRLFKSTINGQEQNEFVIGDIDGTILRSVIEYIYTERIDVNEENVELLLAAASFFLFPQLEHKCTDFLVLPGVLNESNCVEIFDIAFKYAFVRLQEAALAFILDHFAEVISNHDKYLRLSKPGLVQLLKCDYIAADSEEKIFNALVKWVQFDVTMRKPDFPELVRLIRLNSLTRSVSKD